MRYSQRPDRSFEWFAERCPASSLEFEHTPLFFDGVAAIALDTSSAGHIVSCGTDDLRLFSRQICLCPCRILFCHMN
jgi:hypothetical protein